MLSQSAIKQLQQIMKDEYGHDLSEKDTGMVGEMLVEFFDTLKDELKNNDDETEKQPNN